jgi:hypothetical protein
LMRVARSLDGGKISALGVNADDASIGLLPGAQKLAAHGLQRHRPWAAFTMSKNLPR